MTRLQVAPELWLDLDTYDALELNPSRSRRPLADSPPISRCAPTAATDSSSRHGTPPGLLAHCCLPTVGVGVRSRQPSAADSAVSRDSDGVGYPTAVPGTVRGWIAVRPGQSPPGKGYHPYACVFLLHPHPVSLSPAGDGLDVVT